MMSVLSLLWEESRLSGQMKEGTFLTGECRPKLTGNAASAIPRLCLTASQPICEWT